MRPGWTPQLALKLTLGSPLPGRAVELPVTRAFGRLPLCLPCRFPISGVNVTGGVGEVRGIIVREAGSG